MPLRFIDLKQTIIPQDEEARKRIIDAWNELLLQLKATVGLIKKEGSNVGI